MDVSIGSNRTGNIERMNPDREKNGANRIAPDVGLLSKVESILHSAAYMSVIAGVGYLVLNGSGGLAVGCGDTNSAANGSLVDAFMDSLVRVVGRTILGSSVGCVIGGMVGLGQGKALTFANPGPSTDLLVYGVCIGNGALVGARLGGACGALSPLYDFLGQSS